MSPTTLFSTSARPSRSVRLLGGTASALAMLALLSGCGSLDTSSDAPEPSASPAIAAEAETDEQDGTETASSDSATSTADTDSTTETTSSPAETDSNAPAEDEPAESTGEAAAEAPQAEPQSFSGTGSEVVMLETLGDDFFYATVTHDGSENFALWSVDENGQDLDLMVNEIGGYTGQVALNFREDPAAIRVEADGAWSIDLVLLSEAPRWEGDAPYEATGDSIVIVDGVADGLTPVTLTHDGESNFAIWAWGEDYPDLIVNDIGAYEGTTLLPDGSQVLQVQADGTWSIAKN